MTESLTNDDLKDFCADYIFNPVDSNGTDNYTDSSDPNLNCLQFTSNVATTCNYYNPQQFESLCKSIPHTFFSTCHLNIRSLSKNYDEFTNYISSFNDQFTIIALSETWLTESTEMLLDIPFDKAVHRFKHRELGEVCLFMFMTASSLVLEKIYLRN